MGISRYSLAVVLTIIVALAAVVWLYPSDEDFASDNVSWNGMNDFAELFGAVPMSELSVLPAEAGGTTLLVVPGTPFTAAELDGIREYALSGGTLVLLDDYGYGNSVLHHLGVDAAFSGAPLLDPMFNYRNKSFPRVSDLEAAAGAARIVLNHATALTGVSDGDVLGRSSRFSYLDENGDGAWGDGEMYGPFPVAAVIEAGAGRVVLVGDPSILINSMLAMDDNRAFVKSIVGFGGGSRVLLDQSHLADTSLQKTKDSLSAVRQALARPVGVLALVTVIVMLALRPVWRREKGAVIG